MSHFKRGKPAKTVQDAGSPLRQLLSCHQSPGIKAYAHCWLGTGLKWISFPTPIHNNELIFPGKNGQEGKEPCMYSIYNLLGPVSRRWLHNVKWGHCVPECVCTRDALIALAICFSIYFAPLCHEAFIYRSTIVPFKLDTSCGGWNYYRNFPWGWGFTKSRRVVSIIVDIHPILL